VNKPIITATISITFHEEEQAIEGERHSRTMPAKVAGSSNSITFHKEEQAIDGVCHTRVEPAMVKKSTHCAEMKQTGKEMDQD